MTQTAPITLTQYGRMAEKHWREFRPKMVQEMEATGTLQERLYEAQEATRKEMDDLTEKLIQQQYSPQQAETAAWEVVRQRYILLPPEDQEV
ncbi:MAG TPA: TnpV protein [Verrucomicrobiae bacterium]|jgi:formate dehydrogenase maturation protein FdhE